VEIGDWLMGIGERGFWEKCRENDKKMQNYLRMSEKSSNFAADFVENRV
jgi:hypothetical protein